MTPNQYRCETCNHLASDRRNYCNFLKNEIHSSPLIFIELCGCASHSDFQSQSERETILLSCIKSGNIIEAREALEHLFDRHNTCKSERTRCPLCREELRQAGEP